MNRYTIAQLQQMRESEDHVEFKKGEGGNVSYNGSDKKNPKDRRKCILGYVIALCNEGGGRMVIGMHDAHPHKVIGTKQNMNALGDLASDIYRDTGIRPDVYELYGDEANKMGRVVVIEVPSRPIGKVFKFDFLMKYGKARWPELEKIVGNHLSSKQLRRYLNTLRKEGMLKTEGQRNTMYYMIGDAYQANSEVVNKALAIGLQKMKEDGEI